MQREDKPCQPQATLIFSSTLSSKLEDEWRLPGHCIGTRKVRAGSKLVLDLLKSEKRARREAFRGTTSYADEDIHPRSEHTSVENRNSNPVDDVLQSFGMSTIIPNEVIKRNTVTYKIMGENGVERRMTVKEKKEYKKILKKSERDCTSSIGPPDMGSSSIIVPKPSEASHPHRGELLKRQYHQLTIDVQILKAEIDQIRGERQGIMPIMLSEPLSRQFHSLPLSTIDSVETASNTITSHTKHFIHVDDTLAFHWAQVLKSHLRSAEDIRSQEDLRPLAYTITPEVWVRLRPTTNTNPVPQPWEYNNIPSIHNISEDNHRKPWILTWNRPPCTTTEDVNLTLDEQLSMIHSCFYHMAPSMEDDPSLKKDIYISCGAKFGSDYLLYDGKRQSRHAFAGLRCIAMCKDTVNPWVDGDLSWEDAHVENILPKLSPYDMAGFVRGLNTAGKLALVATVVTKRHYSSVQGPEEKELSPQGRNSEPYYVHHVAIVDLALEKVLDAPTHLKKSPKLRKPRKDMGLNLDKTKK